MSKETKYRHVKHRYLYFHMFSVKPVEKGDYPDGRQLDLLDIFEKIKSPDDIPGLSKTFVNKLLLEQALEEECVFLVKDHEDDPL